jgi:hypothetical protein
VGQKEQTSGKCGQTLGFKGCLDVEKHNHSDLVGHNHADMVYIKRIVHSCDKPTCKVCFKRGWAVREAGASEDRVNLASKTFGLSQHIILSVPKEDYRLSYEELKKKALENLKALGVLGGVLIFHMERYHNKLEARIKGGEAGWFVSLHFHVLGYIDGGYPCRNCKKARSECFGCKGFDGEARRLNALKDSSGYGWIFKIPTDKYGRVQERKTVFGTMWYQLNHATIVKNDKRSSVVTWFGVCSYKRLKLKKGDRKNRDVCPICQHELVDIMYVGNDPKSLRFDSKISEWEELLFDKDGSPNWIIKPKCVS